MTAENQKTEVLKNTAVPTSRRRILCRVQLIGGKEAKHRSCMDHVLLRAGLLTDRPSCVLFIIIIILAEAGAGSGSGRCGSS